MSLLLFWLGEPAAEVAAAALPHCLRNAPNSAWNLVGAGLSGGAAPAGLAAAASTQRGGLWLATFPDLFFRSAAEALAFRALRMSANGGVSPLIIPRFDSFAPWPTVDGRLQTNYDAAIHDDGSFVTDGGENVAPVIVATAARAAAFGATRLTVEIAYGGVLRGGEAFSIYHAGVDWRLYEIKSVVIDGDGNSVVTFMPPLREAIGAGKPLEFDKPRCLMRALGPAALKFTLRAFPYTPASAGFIEHFR